LIGHLKACLPVIASGMAVWLVAVTLSTPGRAPENDMTFHVENADERRAIIDS